MIRRGLAIMLGAALLLSASGTRAVFAKAGGGSAEEVRAKVARLGVGEKARVEVRLRDGWKLEGYVRRAGDETFDVTEDDSGVTIEVAYSDVAQIRKRGGGASSTTKALIWGGAAAGAAVVLFAVRGVFRDGICV